MSPKHEFAHLYLAVFNKNYLFCFYILKIKSIRAFMNGNNSLTLGLCRRLTVLCVVTGNKDLIFALGSVLIARDHTENRSLTCGKDSATNCYSLNNSVVLS